MRRNHAGCRSLRLSEYRVLRCNPPHVTPRFQDVYVGGMLSASRTKGDAERDSASQGSTNVTSEMLLLRTTWTSVFGPFKWTFG